MEDNKRQLERSIIRALFHSLIVSDEDIRWRRCHFDKARLASHLGILGEVAPEFVDEFAAQYGMSILRSDPLTVNIRGFERKFDRQGLAEGTGAMGVQFFPTRHSAMRSAFESAREVAYFGYGTIKDQTFECPIARISSQISGIKDGREKQHAILRDMRGAFATNKTICDVLERDKYFHAPVTNEASLAAFQKQLRQSAIDNAVIEKCSEFFNRRATVGIRDTLRWLLGARHPWFDWAHAKMLMEQAFEKHGKTNFNTPQIVYYAYDPEIADADIDAAENHNEDVVRAFASNLINRLRQNSDDVATKIESNIRTIARWILDIHHDYPDFDMEAAGNSGPSMHIDFLGHSIQNTVNQEILGQNGELRRNFNFPAHFDALELTESLLGTLDDAGRETFFAAVKECVAEYDRIGGIPVNGQHLEYKRIPCVLFVIQDLATAKPRDNERLLDTFDLSKMTELEHASYMRAYPEISEKLVVFFVLTLRHMIDTEHVPDLRPRNFIKDFMLLGLWGTRTPNILVNLYVDAAQDNKDLAKSLSRCEIRFVGMEQVETHPLEHIREGSKALRLAVAHFAPLIEPSILRNIGTFTMAMEEFRDNSHEFMLDPFNLMHYGIDLAHEMARCGVRRSLTDILALLEYLINSTHQNVEQNFNKTASFLKHKKK